MDAPPLAEEATDDPPPDAEPAVSDAPTTTATQPETTTTTTESSSPDAPAPATTEPSTTTTQPQAETTTATTTTTEPASSDEPEPTTAEPETTTTEPSQPDEESVLDEVLRLLDELEVLAEQPDGYDRDLFDHWNDADRDGCNARKEVLLIEAVVAPEIGARCALSGGRWVSRYDGAVTEGTGRGFDVDHMVPLKEAWDSGAHAWTEQRREDYANDLGYEHSLIAVSASSNRSKGARDPAEWLPPDQETHCWYAAAWVQVKTRWSLSTDQAEHRQLRQILENCATPELS